MVKYVFDPYKYINFSFYSLKILFLNHYFWFIWNKEGDNISKRICLYEIRKSKMNKITLD